MSDQRTWPHHELGKARTGKTFDLGIPYDKNGPFLPGGFRINPVRVMTFMPSDTAVTADNMISADDMVIMGLQAATQWDSLAHVGYDGSFYSNVPAAAVTGGCGSPLTPLAIK